MCVCVCVCVCARGYMYIGFTREERLERDLSPN